MYRAAMSRELCCCMAPMAAMTRRWYAFIHEKELLKDENAIGVWLLISLGLRNG